MKPNSDKRHLVTTEKSVSINNEGSNVKNKKEQKLLGHITSLYKKSLSKTTCTRKNSQLYGPS